MDRIAGEADRAREPIEAVRCALGAIARFCRWPAGHAYLPCQGHWWSPADGWYVEGGCDMAACSQAWINQPPPNEPSAGTPTVVADLQAAGEHYEALRQAGLAAALLLPVMAAGSPVAILEFFAAAPIHVDEEQRLGLGCAACLLGNIVQRLALEQQLADLAIKEQRKFGQDLHDTVSQQISAMGIIAGGLKQRLAGTPEEARAARLVEELDRTRAQVRAMARGLPTVDVDAAGLKTALQQVAQCVGQLYEVDCRVECPHSLHVEDAVATQLFYMAREAVVNAAKHGRPRSIHVQIDSQPGRLILKVNDDGAGLADGANMGSGMGLRIMRCRARMIGADLHIKSTPGRGVGITCSIGEGA